MKDLMDRGNYATIIGRTGPAHSVRNNTVENGNPELMLLPREQ